MPRLNDAIGVRRDGVEALRVMAQGIQVWPTFATIDFTLSSSILPTPVFPISVANGNRGFADANSTPFFGVADTLWNGISRMSAAEFTQYAQTRRTQGYTAVLLSVLDINSRNRTQAVSGTTPFIGSGNSASFTSPNLSGTTSYWDHVEWCVDELAANGLLAVLVPAWYGWQGNMWRGHIAASDTDTTIATSYGNFLASRLGDRSNVWWLLGGDNGPTTANGQASSVPAGMPSVSVVAATNALATALKTGASVSQLMTYHTYRNDAAWNYFGSESWYDMHAAYSATDTAVRVVPEYTRASTKPVFLVEAYYDARGSVAGASPDLTRKELRTGALQAMLSGALAAANGHEAVWPVREWYAGVTWVDGINATSVGDLTVLSRLLASFPGKHFLADIADPLVSSNRGSGVSLAPGIIATDSSVAIVYVPDARTIALKTSLMPGASWHWLHPETTQTVLVQSSLSALSAPSGWNEGILIGLRA